MRALRTFAITACVAAACALQGDGRVRPGFDDPEAREAWEQAVRGPMAPDYLAAKRVFLMSAQRVARMQAAASTLPAPVWRNIGVFGGQTAWGSLGGRLRAIVPHPTDRRILYIATAGGGVWKTTDADPTRGSVWTWKPLTDGIAAASASGNIAVGGLAMDAADPQTLYLALGDPFQSGGARGFFVTRDGGATWEDGGLPDGATGAVYAAFSPAPRTILVGGDRGLWRSADGGASFSYVPLRGMATVYSVAQFADGTLAVGAGSGSGILNTIFLFSTDAGATWTQAVMPDMKIGRVTIATSGATGWALANKQWDLLGGLLHSADSGRSWSWVASSGIDPVQGWYNQALAVDPDDPARVIAGSRQPFVSTDAGLSWSYFAFTHPDLHAASWWAAAPKRLLLGHDGGLTLVQNLWDRHSFDSDSSHNDGVASQLAYGLSSSLAPGPDGERNRVAVALQDHGCLLGRAGSGRFDLVTSCGDGFSVLLHPLDGSIWLCSVNSEIWRFESTAYSSHNVTLRGAIRLFPDESDPSGNTVYALGSYEIDSDAIYRSVDFGRSWTALGTAGWAPRFRPSAFASSRTQPGTLFAARGVTGYLTRDGGQTWKGVSVPWGKSGIVSAWIEGSAIYLASPLQDTTSHHIWKSADWGSTWQTADSGLPPFPVWRVRADPGAAWVLWAATDVGVYRSGDAGRSWSRFGAGLPWVAVRDIYVAPDDSVLRIATYGRGLWEVPITKPDDPPPPDPPPSDPPPSAPRPGADSGGCSSPGGTGAWTMVPLILALRRRFQWKSCD